MSIAHLAPEPERKKRGSGFDPQPRPWPLRVAAIGGGTGLPMVLEGLRRIGGRMGSAFALDVTAIVAVGDDGGSSGRIRRERGILPPGDVRRCLLALAQGQEAALARLFSHRFVGGRELGGHATGNLLLAALAELEGGFLAGIREAERLLGCMGRVLPCTLEPIELVGVLEDGSRLVGQHRFDGRWTRKLRRVELSPVSPAPTAGVLEAIRDADVVVLGPGSLYSSVIANLLVDGVAEAVRANRGHRVLIQNLVCQPGESFGMNAAAHLEAVLAHAGEVVDVLLVDPGARARAREGEDAVACEIDDILSLGVVPVEADLIATGRRLSHDPDKTALAVVALAMMALEV